MLQVGQLEDLGWDGGQTIAVQTENLQTAGQVGEAARLQQRDTVVVQEAGRHKRERLSGMTSSLDSMRDRRHSQVPERQHGEGAGPDVANDVVAKVQCFQAQEGLQLLRGDPPDPVVCSEKTHTAAPINDRNKVLQMSNNRALRPTTTYHPTRKHRAL